MCRKHVLWGSIRLRERVWDISVIISAEEINNLTIYQLAFHLCARFLIIELYRCETNPSIFRKEVKRTAQGGEKIGVALSYDP